VQRRFAINKVKFSVLSLCTRRYITIGNCREVLKSQNLLVLMDALADLCTSFHHERTFLSW
jgi:hypothetical protein